MGRSLESMRKKRVILVGIPKATHVGMHLLEAAQEIGVEVSVQNMEAAYEGPRILRSIFWHLLGHRPLKLGTFSAQLIQRCEKEKPDLVIMTGIAPVNENALRRMATLHIPTVNFLTDDPWNDQHFTSWFLKALPHYAHVFTPRRANEVDLKKAGVNSLSYMPFAAAPKHHHPPQNLSEQDRLKWGGLVAFIGGADRDRVSMIRSLVKAGIPVALWGGYWSQFRDLAAYAHGHADVETCRKIVATAGANLCLVRRANRDSHSMRSYELPATGGCLLVEDTEDHRRLFGKNGEAVSYFNDTDTMISQAKWLLSLSEEKKAEMRTAASSLIDFSQTYAARLNEMMNLCKR